MSPASRDRVELRIGQGANPGVSAAVACRLLVLVGILGNLGCAARSAGAGSPGTIPGLDDWSAVTKLASESSLRIDVSGGLSTTGRFVSADDDQVTIRRGSAERIFLRPDIRRVVLVHRHTAEKAKRGLVIGALAGGLVGALGTESNRLPWAAFLAVGWGAIGAAIGASDGFSDREETVVYAVQVEAAHLQSSELANMRMEPSRR
jgi:uncharacterized protein YcfJ